MRSTSLDAQQFKAILAAEIIKALDRDRLTVRAAHDRTGFADVGRFTVDRLISIINRLGSRVEVKVRVRRAEPLGGLTTCRRPAQGCVVAPQSTNLRMPATIPEVSHPM